MEPTGEKPTYPSVVVDIDDIGTDRVRFEGFTKIDREVYRDSWFADFGKDKTIVEPKGYLAPPLHGVWASAPYFHNGSVTTLWHVLHPAQRPVVWKRHETKYDGKKSGWFLKRLKGYRNLLSETIKSVSILIPGKPAKIAMDTTIPIF